MEKVKKTIIEKCKVLNWLGSKSSELHVIYNFVMDCIDVKQYNKFVDVFGGSGLVGFWLKTLDEFKHIKFIYNDCNEKLYNLFSILQDKETRVIFLDKYNEEMNKFNNLDEPQKIEYFRNIVKLSSNPLSCPSLDGGLQNNLYFYIICLLCFRGIYSENKSINPNLKKKDGVNIFSSRFKNPDVINKFSQIIEDVDLYNEDYKTILDNYEQDETAILYLDPPYIKRNSTDYVQKKPFEHDDILYICDYMKKAKCKVILNIDFSPMIYLDLLKDYKKLWYYIKYKVVKNYKNCYTDVHTLFLNEPDLNKN